jgi:hypothetical protein
MDSVSSTDIENNNVSYFYLFDFNRRQYIMFEIFDVDALTHVPPKRTVTPVLRCVLNDDECAICLDPMPKRSETASPGCQHDFHPSCLNKWFENNETCPVCRTHAGDSITPQIN